jgi:hypothetical protein
MPRKRPAVRQTRRNGIGLSALKSEIALTDTVLIWKLPHGAASAFLAECRAGYASREGTMQCCFDTRSIVFVRV